MSTTIADRVKETTNTGGTGTVVLLGAVTGFRTFSSACSDGSTVYYCIASLVTGEWEVGQGTYSAGTLARITVYSSSNAGSLVNFTTATKDVFLTFPAEAQDPRPPVQQLTTTIQPAAIATLFTAPVVVIPSIANKIIQPLAWHMRKAAGTAWTTTGSGQLGIQYSTPTFLANVFSQAFTTNLFGSGETIWSGIMGNGQFAALGTTTPDYGSSGASVRLALATANISGGTGNITFWIAYQVFNGLGFTTPF